MDILMPKSELERLVFGWNEALGARLLALLVVAWLLWCLLKALRAPGCSVLWPVTLGCMSVVLSAFAVAPQAVVNRVVSVEYVARVRLIAVVISLLVTAITLEAIRKTRLSERYALLWLATAAAIILAAAYPRAVALMRALTGMSYTAAMVSVLMVFVLLVLFHFSVTLTVMHSRQDRIARRLAILEARLDALESSRRSTDTGDEA